MELGDMLPFDAMNDFIDVGLRDTKPVRDLLLANGSGGVLSSDAANVVIRELMGVMRFATHPFSWWLRWFGFGKGAVNHANAVPHVFGHSAPLKIRKAVVAWVPVNVVYVWPKWMLAKKREKDQSVNAAIDNGPIFPKAYPEVSPCCYVGLQNEDRLGSSASPRFASYAPQIANRVKSIVSRNCFPLLRRATDLVRHLQPSSSRLSLFRCGNRLQPFLASPF